MSVRLSFKRTATEVGNYGRKIRWIYAIAVQRSCKRVVIFRTGSPTDGQLVPCPRLPISCLTDNGLTNTRCVCDTALRNNEYSKSITRYVCKSNNNAQHICTYNSTQYAERHIQIWMHVWVLP